MDVKQSASGKSCIIHLSGKFTFSDHVSFKSIRGLFSEDAYDTIIFDFSEVTFMDSSALGMMMIAREEATTHNKNIILRKPKDKVEKMFRVSKFDTIFTIEF